MLVSQGFDAALAGVLGLLIGSFLNVVIYRTPVMMYRDWLNDAVANLMSVKDMPSLWSLVFGPKAQPRPASKLQPTRPRSNSRSCRASTSCDPARAAAAAATRSAGTRTSRC